MHNSGGGVLGQGDVVVKEKEMGRWRGRQHGMVVAAGVCADGERVSCMDGAARLWPRHFGIDKGGKLGQR